MRLRKDVPDEMLLSAGVHNMDPTIGILASQAGMLLGRRKTRMDDDRRDSKPPPAYKDRSKVLYRLGDVLAERARMQGITIEQAAKNAQEAKQGWPTFAGFVQERAPDRTWPITTVQGYPVDFFSTLGMDLDEPDLGEIEDLTADEFVQRRVAFYRDRPGGWGIAPTLLGQEWAGALQMATSRTEAWERGHEQAVISLTEQEEGLSKAQQRERWKEQQAKLASSDYQGVREALDNAPADFYMSRFTVMFYLGMSPTTFKQALDRGPHPFGTGKAGANKSAVDAWFKGLLEQRHAQDIPKVSPLRMGRDMSSGRPYLVDTSGVILADATITNIDPRDVAYAHALGAGLTILSPDTALGMPWRDLAERAAWANQRQIRLKKALAQAEAQDLEAGFPQKPHGKRNPL